MDGGRQEENEAWRIKMGLGMVLGLIIAFKAGWQAGRLFGLICMASIIRPAYLIYREALKLYTTTSHQQPIVLPLKEDTCVW